MATTEQLIIEARIEDGISKSLKEIAEASAAMGASVDETRAAMTSLDKSAKSLDIPLSKAKEAFKGLVRETEDATEATRHLGVTMRYQAATGINSTAAAAKDIGDVLGGGTRALRQFDAHAAAMADQIDKIKDPAKRAELAMKELERAIKRQNSPLQKFKNGLGEIKTGLTRMGPALSLVGGGLAAVAGTISGVLIASIKHYVDNSAQMQKSIGALNKAVDEFKFQLGGAIVASGKTSNAVDAMTGAVKAATDWVKKNADTIATWTKTAIRGGLVVAKVVGNIMFGLAEFVSLVIEGISEGMRKVFGTLAELGIEIVDALDPFASLLPDAMKGAIADARTFFEVVRNEGQAPVDLAITQGIVEAQDKYNELIDSVSKGFEGAGKAPGKAAMKRTGGAKREFAEVAGHGAEFGTNFAAIAAQETTLQNMELAQQLGRDAAQAIGSAWAESARSFEQLMQQQNALTFLGEVNNAMDRLTSSTLDMTIALADGSLQWRDLGNAVASQTGSILQDSGKALAEYAIKSGAIFQAFGFSLEAMKSLSGIGLILAAGSLIAAGSLLSRFGDTATPARQRASRGDSRAANELERLGRNLIERSSSEEGRTVVLNVDGYEIGGWMREQMIENNRRGRTRRT